MLYSVRVFSTACIFALITSVVSKWQLFSFIFSRGNREKQREWETTVMLFSVKEFLVKSEVLGGALL
jgi:hypothetical protein